RERAHQNRADQTDRVSFKNVCRHAGAIADVVANVVCDRGRITRIVFFETLLNFADQICSDIGCFGVNATAESREDADQARTEGETNQTENDTLDYADPDNLAIQLCLRALQHCSGNLTHPFITGW